MNWDKIHSSREGAKYPDTEVVRFMAKNFYHLRTEEIKVLDIGCGTGANLKYLWNEGFCGYGVDESKVAIHKCREKLPQLVGWPLYCMPIPEFLSTVEPDSFDAILDIEAVYANMPAVGRQIYLQCYRTLKPGGRMLIKHFAEGTSQHLLDQTYMQLISKEQVPDLIGRFKIEACEMHTRTVGAGIIKEWVIELIK